MSNMGARSPESGLDQQKLPSLLLGIGGRGKRGFKSFSKLPRPNSQGPDRFQGRNSKSTRRNLAVVQP